MPDNDKQAQALAAVQNLRERIGRLKESNARQQETIDRLSNIVTQFEQSGADVAALRGELEDARTELNIARAELSELQDAVLGADADTADVPSAPVESADVVGEQQAAEASADDSGVVGDPGPVGDAGAAGSSTDGGAADGAAAE